MPNDLITSNGQRPQTVATPKRPSNVWLIIVAGLFIIVPFLAWYFTWFGRNLSDADVAKYLAEEKNPRHVQHALLQVEQKMERNDPSARQFYPQIIALTKSATVEVRKTVAWVMGQDNKSEEFHRALLELLRDNEPLVRRNAALQLVRFGDAAGRAELRAMLQPFEVKAPFSGTIVSFLPDGSNVRGGALLARIRDASGNVQEFRSPVDGRVSRIRSVADGAEITAGQTLLWMIPDRATLLESLRALAYVGMKEDLELIESTNRLDASSETSAQVVQTTKAISSR